MPVREKVGDYSRIGKIEITTLDDRPVLMVGSTWKSKALELENKAKREK